MALIKTARQVSCPNCQAANPDGSPYCVRCGAPLGQLQSPSALAGAAPAVPPSRFSSPALRPETPHFLDSYLTEGQDPALAKSVFERAVEIMMPGETIDYIATANRAVGHMPDCAVATSKRMLVYKKRTFGRIELDDMSWRDLDDLQVKDSRNGALLIFASIQGWQIIAEGIPKSQAWHLHEFALKHSERMSSKMSNAPQTPEPSQAVSPAPAASQQAPSTTARTHLGLPAESAPSRQYVYAAQAAEPAQVAAFHTQPPAESEVVVFDTQVTQPVLRTSPSLSASAIPTPANGLPRPASGPLASQQMPQAQSAAPSVPQPVAPGTPVKTTGPLTPSQAQVYANAQSRTGSGPLSARLGVTTPTAQARPAPGVSAPLSETRTQDPGGLAQDDLVGKMKQLKEMLEADLITRDEFDTKKSEILARL